MTSGTVTTIEDREPLHGSKMGNPQPSPKLFLPNSTDAVHRLNGGGFPVWGA
jgi:hypothetical protein